MKTCTKCKDEKQLSEFYKTGKYLASYCKPCHSEFQKKYLQSDSGKETRKKYMQSEARKEYQKRYGQSEARKETRKKYEQSEARKEIKREFHKTDAFKEAKRKYKQSDAGKQKQKKYQKKHIKTEKYFKQKLNAKGFKENDITPELIELQKLSIVTYRYTQELNQVK